MNCQSSISSEAIFIDVSDPLQFRASFNLGRDEDCTFWITDQVAQKRRDVEEFVLEALSDTCGYSVPCIVNSTFSCQGDEVTIT